MVKDALLEKSIQSPCWSTHDIALTIQGFNKYGDDFKAIAEVVGTKSESSIMAFYNYYRESLNLDKLQQVTSTYCIKEKRNIFLLIEFQKIKEGSQIQSSLYLQRTEQVEPSRFTS